jgi:hypothetical protein
LIEWIQELCEYEQFEGVLSECGLIEQILNKAKEIKGK